MTTVLAPTTSNGIYFPPSIQAHTVLDRMEIRPGGAGIAAGVTMDGARNVELSRVWVYSLSGLTDAVGVDLSSGAEAALSGLSITLVAITVTDLGLSRFGLKYSNGTLPHDALMRSIELYGTKIVPLVRAGLPRN
jgi:hypothetical protein